MNIDVQYLDILILVRPLKKSLGMLYLKKTTQSMTVLCLKSHKMHHKKYINFPETLSLIKVRFILSCQNFSCSIASRRCVHRAGNTQSVLPITPKLIWGYRICWIYVVVTRTMTLRNMNKFNCWTQLLWCQ